MTGPAPWSADTPTLLAAGPLGHTATATVTTADGDTITLNIIDATISYDETRYPRTDATLTCHLPADAALVERIDPRKACRVKIGAGYVRPDGTRDVQPIADLGLRSRSRSRPDDTLTLVARSDEAVLVDASPSTTLSLSTASTLDAINTILTGVAPLAVLDSTGLTSTGPAVSFTENNVDRITALNDFVDRIGAAFWHDGGNAWRITDRPNTTGPPTLTLADGAGGTLVSIGDDLDRDADWYNRVQVVYEWQDMAGVDRRVIGSANAPGAYAPTTGNTRTLYETRDTPTDTLSAGTVAANLVSRTVTRGRAATITTPSAYWLRPGDTVELREAGRTDRHLVTAVSFDLRSGLMTLTTRQPGPWLGTWDAQPYNQTWDGTDPTLTWDTYAGG